MAKRDRAAYMRAYRAKRAEGEGVSAPPPVGKLRDRADAVRADLEFMRPFIERAITETTIQRMSQAERDRILRKLTK